MRSRGEDGKPSGKKSTVDSVEGLACASVTLAWQKVSGCGGGLGTGTIVERL